MQKLFGLLAVGLALCAAALPSAQTRAVPLTPDDFAQIHQLYALYPYSFDGSGATPTNPKWGDVFTADGVHISGSEYFKGREILNAYAGGQLRFERGALGGPGLFSLDTKRPTTKNEYNVAHFITNILLEPLPDGSVKAKAYLMGVNVGTQTIFPRGIYFDTIVKTGEGWRFHIKHFISGDSPVPVTVPDVFKNKPAPALNTSR